jgi:3-hydroxyacyl-[acyl-carrier-protein] dehydratase
VIPFPNPELRRHMDAMAKRIGFPQQVVSHD